MQTEPSTIIGTITGLAAAVVAALIAFGVDLSQDQQNALLGLVAVVAPIVAGVLIRSKVFAPATVEKLTTKAYQAGTPPTQPKPEVPSPPATV